MTGASFGKVREGHIDHLLLAPRSGTLAQVHTGPLRLEQPAAQCEDGQPLHERAAYRIVARTILETLPQEGLLVLPYLVVGGTDAKYYAGRSDNVFRFLPVNFGDAGAGGVGQRQHP